jgi:hypothetical protein
MHTNCRAVLAADHHCRDVHSFASDDRRVAVIVQRLLKTRIRGSAYPLDIGYTLVSFFLAHKNGGMNMKGKPGLLMMAAVFLWVIFAFTSTAQAVAVSFSGDTSSSSPSMIDSFLTFTSTTFTNISVPVGAGSTTLPDLGTFTLNVCSGNNCTESFGIADGVSDFRLRIAFTDPTVTGNPQLFATDIYGTVTRSGNSDHIKNGSVSIDFDNAPRHLTYTTQFGSGAFDLSVNDPAAFESSASFGDTRTVTGQIANLTFTPQDPQIASVAEPGSIVLLLAGLGGVAVRLRHGRAIRL